MKKLLNYLLVIALVLVQFVPVVNAASIKIDPSVVGQTYNAYKIFDVTNSGSNYAYSIENTSKWYPAVAAYATSHPNAFTLKRVGTTTKYVVIPGSEFTTDANAKAFADYLNTYLKTVEEAKKPTPEKSVKAKKDVDTVLTDLAKGYYFVDSSLGALCILNTAADAITVEEKNAEPTIEKTASQATAGVGQTVNFTIKVTAGGAADTSYIVKDTMTDGLDLVADSIAIKVDDAVVATSNYSITTSAHGFEITFNPSYTASLAKGKIIVITYNAIVNEKAIEVDGVTNEAKLEYGGSSTVETITLKNYDFQLVKTDENKAELTGAEFKLYTAAGVEIPVVLVQEGVYRVAKAGETGVVIKAGNVRINGLASGTYALEETKAPEGYNQLVARQEFTITNADLLNTSAVKVVNTTGVILPSTGGMGTVLFLTIGSFMVIGFGVLLVTKLRLAKMSI